MVAVADIWTIEASVRSAWYTSYNTVHGIEQGAGCLEAERLLRRVIAPSGSRMVCEGTVSRDEDGQGTRCGVVGMMRGGTVRGCKLAV